MRSVLYLGDMKEVAERLKSLDGIRLAGWIAEEDDEVEGADRRVKKPADLQCELEACGPVDLGIMANFGLILDARTLSIPKLGFINAHMGLLPEYPGRHPIQKALDAGEEVVGVTLHRVTENVDSGEVLMKRSFAVGPRRVPQLVFERMARLIPDMLSEYLKSRLTP